MYHAVGYSFNVSVMKFNSTTTAFVAFIFVPIMSASPLIVIDNSDTFIHFQFPNLAQSLEPEMSALLKPNNTLGVEQVQGTSVGPNGTSLAPRIWIANATTMFANPMTSSADAATYMFKSDQAGYNQDLARNQTTTSLRPVINPSSCGMFELICSLPITVAIEWVGGAIVGLLVLYFGGLREVVQLLTDQEERKKVIDEIRQLLRLFRLRRPKKVGDIPNQDQDTKTKNKRQQSQKDDWLGKGRPRKQSSVEPSAEVPLVARTSNLSGWNNPIQPEKFDDRFRNVYGIFFYPKEVSWEKGDRDPRKNMLRFKVVVNHESKKAFWMVDYALGLFKDDKIQSVTMELEPYTNEKMKRALKQLGFELQNKTAYESDLIEKEPSVTEAKVLNSRIYNDVSAILKQARIPLFYAYQERDSPAGQTVIYAHI